MNARNGLRRPQSCGYLWAARAAAVLLVAFWLLFALGEGEGGLPNLAAEPWSVRLLFLGWLALFVSYAVGWRHHGVGGAAGIAALAFMYAVEFAANGRPLGTWFLLWGIPNVLFLLTAWMQRRHGPGCSVG